MASVCNRCALRIQRAATTSKHPLSIPARRAFFSTTPTAAGVPTFSATSNPELDDVLASMRDKHFIPAYMSKHERRLIFGDKYRIQLQENPQSVTLGDEEIPLQWIDRRTEIPNRTELLHKAINMMAAGQRKDWNNLPSVLTGLHQANAVPKAHQMEKIVRLAVVSGRIGIVLQCLHQAHLTGVSLRRDEVLRAMVWGLHHTAQSANWERKAILKAIKDANEVAMRLETEEHGGGTHMHPNDRRRRPEVLAVFLELTAAYATKHQGKEDTDGKVKAYAERLLSNIDQAKEPNITSPAARGMRWDMLMNVPVWHGLSLARGILGKQMPMAGLADEVIRNYEAGLTKLAQEIEAQNPPAGSYGEQALKAWRECIQV